MRYSVAKGKMTLNLKTNRNEDSQNYRDDVGAGIVQELQLVKGLRDVVGVAQVGEEEPPVHRRPGDNTNRAASPRLSAHSHRLTRDTHWSRTM